MQTVKIPAYEALAHDIKALGVEAVFGLMSDDTALLVTTLDSMGVPFLGSRHENNAISMAEGYAAATGKLGIAILGRGPATANSIHGAVYALKSGSPVLLIFGEASTTSSVNGFGPDTKGFNTLGVLAAAGIKTFTPTEAESVRRVAANAIAAAHHGAVALLLPMNAQFGEVDYAEDLPAVFKKASLPVQRARTPAIHTAAALLRDSRKPLIVAGLGAHRSGARDMLIKLADHIGAGLATTLKAKDMFKGHPFDVGILGSFSHAGGRRLIEQADCVLIFGAGMNQRTTSFGTSLPGDVPIIHVDRVRNNIGRWFHADVAVVADAHLAAEQLLKILPPRPDQEKPLHSEQMRTWLADFNMADEFQPENTPRTMDPRSLAIEMDKLLPVNRNVVYDSGNFLQVLPYVSVPGPAHIKSASDFSSIGMGFGTAIGYAKGTPDRTTVLFIGDGSFLMTMGELETVAREGISLVIVLMNDCAYGAELHYLKMRSMPVAMSLFPDIDFAPVAESFGFQGYTVRTLDELRALAPILRNPDGPVLIDCKINGAVAAPFLLETVEHERKK